MFRGDILLLLYIQDLHLHLRAPGQPEAILQNKFCASLLYLCYITTYKKLTILIAYYIGISRNRAKKEKGIGKETEIGKEGRNKKQYKGKVQSEDQSKRNRAKEKESKRNSAKERDSLRNRTKERNIKRNSAKEEWKWGNGST